MSSQKNTKTSSAVAVAPASLWRAIAGFILWSIAFVVLYVGHALACLYVPLLISASGVSTTLLLLWIASLLITLLLWLQSHLRMRGLNAKGINLGHPHFMWRISRLIDGFAVAAVFVTGLPLLAVPACAG